MAHVHAQSHLGAGHLCYLDYAIEQLSRTKKNRSLRNGKLKASRASATEDRGTKGRGYYALIRK